MFIHLFSPTRASCKYSTHSSPTTPTKATQTRIHCRARVHLASYDSAVIVRYARGPRIITVPYTGSTKECSASAQSDGFQCPHHETCWSINRSITHKRWLTIPHIRCAAWHPYYTRCVLCTMSSVQTSLVRKLQRLRRPPEDATAYSIPTEHTYLSAYLDTLPAMLHNNGHLQSQPPRHLLGLLLSKTQLHDPCVSFSTGMSCTRTPARPYPKQCVQEPRSPKHTSLERITSKLDSIR